jgi:hypothetical protein
MRTADGLTLTNPDAGQASGWQLGLKPIDRKLDGNATSRNKTAFGRNPALYLDKAEIVVKEHGLSKTECA